MEKLIIVFTLILLSCSATRIISNVNYKDSDLTPIQIDEKWGFTDDSGNIYIEPKYDSVGFFYNGIAKVKMRNKYGLIKKDNSYLLKPKYSKVGEFLNDCSQVTKGNRSFFIGPQGTEILEPPMPSGGCGSHSLNYKGQPIKINDKYELVIERSKRIDGKYVLVYDTTNFQADTIIDYSDNNIQVAKNGKKGIVRYSPNVKDISIIAKKIKYDSIVTPIEYQGRIKYAKVKTQNLWGLINEDGYEVVEPIYLRILTSPIEIRNRIVIVAGRSIYKNYGKLLVEYEFGKLGYVSLYGKEYFKR